MLDFIYINNLEDYELELDRLANYKYRVALDCETYTKDEYRTVEYDSSNLRTNPHTGEISLISLATDPIVLKRTYVFDIICLKELGCDFLKLKTFLQGCSYLIGHNIKFDLNMLLPVLGSFDKVACTYAMASLYANATGSKLWQTRGMDLGSCCRDWLGLNLEGKGTIQSSEWYSSPKSRRLDNPAWLPKLQYSASDVKYLFELYDILRYVLESPFPSTPLIQSPPSNGAHGLGMGGALNLEFTVVPIVSLMETNGLPYNSQLGELFARAVDKELSASALKLCQMLDLPTVAEGIWGDPIPDPYSLKQLNNPKGLVKLIEAKCQISLPKAQNNLFDRMADLLTSLCNEEEEEREILDSELEIYRQLEDLDAELKSLNAEVCIELVKYKKLVKQKGLILSKFINPQTKRIHPNYQQLRAATGRFSANNPNVQQVSARLELPVDIPLSLLEQLVDIKISNEE